MKLYLMRHGEALSAQADPERGLSNFGKEQITKIAKYLQQKGLMFDRIFHSNRKRARQTAEIMAQAITAETPLNLLENITPTDDPSLIIETINSWHEDTLVTSHLPFIPDLLTILTGQDAYLTAITFEAGTIICLEKNEYGSWEINWSSAPSEI